VLGASGGVGVAAVQLAKALGAGAVIAAVRAEADAAVARAAGADGVVLVGSGQPVRERLREQVASLLGGRGADVVVDPVGGEIGTAALRTLAWCGRLVVIGFAAGAPPEVRANYLLVKNIAVLGLHWSDYRDRTPERVAEAQRAIFAFHEAGRLNPVIEAVLPMSRVRDALRALRDGTVQGKLVLDPSM
jgi:NADPH2:quinone reductase